MAVVALLATACWKPELTPTYSVSVVSDIVYGQGELQGQGMVDLALDLYVPQVEGQDRFPLVLAIHGGGFETGTKTRARIVSWANAFASRGYLVASIDYRLKDDKPIPSARVQPLVDAIDRRKPKPLTTAAIAAIDDALTALDYLHTRPDVEPYQTVITGGSAGAIVALYVGYALDDYGIDRPPVAAVIDNYGGYGWADTPGDATHIDGAASQVLETEPFYFYQEPPLFIAHGTSDAIVSFSLAQEIADRSVAVGLPHVFHAEPGGAHGFDLFAAEFSPGVSVFQAQVNWLDSVLVGAQETTP